MPANIKPAFVYADQLVGKGYGLPLWQPDPPREGEIQIGDVGVLDDGRFIRLFNAMQNARHILNINGVPKGFKQLHIKDKAIQSSQTFLPAGAIFNHRTMSCNVSGGGSVAALNVGAEYKFSCSDDRAAVAILKGCGSQSKVLAHRKIIEYIAAHCDSWVPFADDLDITTSVEDIIFVSGWVKTHEWALAACTANAQSHSLSFEVPIGGFAAATFCVEASNALYPSVDQRSGPPEQSTESDQCLFLRYYKCGRQGILLNSRPRYPNKVDAKDALELNLKTVRTPPSTATSTSKGSLWGRITGWLPGKGRAVRSRISTKEDVTAQAIEGAYPYDILEFPQHCEAFEDPLDVLLEYILANSESKVAIAAHDDLYSLFQNENVWPDDLRAALNNAKPRIHTNDKGVGTLVLDHITESDPGSANHSEIGVDDRVGRDGYDSLKLGALPSEPRGVPEIQQSDLHRSQGTLFTACRYGGPLGELEISQVNHSHEILRSTQTLAGQLLCAWLTYVWRNRNNEPLWRVTGSVVAATVEFWTGFMFHELFCQVFELPPIWKSKQTFTSREVQRPLDMSPESIALIAWIRERWKDEWNRMLRLLLEMVTLDTRPLEQPKPLPKPTAKVEQIGRAHV